jgi:hypothetical protein
MNTWYVPLELQANMEELSEASDDLDDNCNSQWSNTSNAKNHDIEEKISQLVSN